MAIVDIEIKMKDPEPTQIETSIQQTNQPVYVEGNLSTMVTKRLMEKFGWTDKEIQQTSQVSLEELGDLKKGIFILTSDITQTNQFRLEDSERLRKVDDHIKYVYLPNLVVESRTLITESFKRRQIKTVRTLEGLYAELI
jgi:hypothetical protein